MKTSMAVIEAKIVRKLIEDILAAGLTISVYDGGDYPVRYGTDLETVFEALASTSEDELVMYRPKDAQGNRMRVGWLRLVYDGDYSVIQDYTTNLEPQVAGAMKLADELNGAERNPQVAEPLRSIINSFSGVRR
jgi:hypothetical protein